MRRAEAGFTLFEVLAAVAILGVLYTTLISWAMDGLLAEGVSQRRLEASLLADRELAELELDLDAGLVPPVGEEESEVYFYRIVVEVRPFDLLLPDPDPGIAATPVLADLAQDGRSPIREIQVRVSWLEAATEFEVVRTSFAVDSSLLNAGALQAALQGPDLLGDGSAEAPQ